MTSAAQTTVLDPGPPNGLTYALRGVDSFTLSTVSVAVALALARDGGLDAYSTFLSLAVIGAAAGGLLTFVTLNVLRLRGFAPACASTSGLGRIVLAATAADGVGRHVWLLGAACLIVSVASTGLTAMLHSLASRRGGGFASRTGLLAATAVGGVLGTAVAGLVVRFALWGPLVVAEVAGSVAALMIGVRFMRAFPRMLAPPAGPSRTVIRAAGPIAWRVPVIAGIAFSVGSLAPGILTGLRGVTTGALAASVYLLGAVGAAMVIQVANRPPRSAVSAWLGDHRRWFLPSAVGASMWLALPLPLGLCLLGAGLAGVILHLVQAGYEQVTAALGDAERSGPSIVVINSLASLGSAASLVVLPRLMDLLGYTWLIILLVAALGILAVVDQRRCSNACPGSGSCAAHGGPVGDVP